MSIDRASIDARRQAEQEEADLQRAALEQAHAKQLAAKQAVLLQGPNGWQLVKLRNLDPATRQLLLSKVYQDGKDEGLGFFARVRERLDRWAVGDGA